MEKPKGWRFSYEDAYDYGIQDVTKATEWANDRLDKLFKDAVMVYGDHRHWYPRIEDSPVDATHQALLIGIEEIKQCEHVARLDQFYRIDNFGAPILDCAKCGKKLKAKWEPVDD